MPEAPVLFLAHLLGFAGFLWLGLYVLTRGDRGHVATLLAISTLATSCFLLTGALLMALHGASASVTLQRLMWWSDVVPIAAWLHLSLSFTPRAPGAPRDSAALLWFIYVCAALLTLVGATTDLINDYSHIPVTAGPAYILYAAYVLAGTGWAVLGVSRLRAGAPRHADAQVGEQRGARRNG